MLHVPNRQHIAISVVMVEHASLQKTLYSTHTGVGSGRLHVEGHSGQVWHISRERGYKGDRADVAIYLYMVGNHVDELTWTHSQIDPRFYIPLRALEIPSFLQRGNLCSVTHSLLPLPLHLNLRSRLTFLLLLLMPFLHLVLHRIVLRIILRFMLHFLLRFFFHFPLGVLTGVGQCHPIPQSFRPSGVCS